jgi:cytochrome c peroxidase
LVGLLLAAGLGVLSGGVDVASAEQLASADTQALKQHYKRPETIPFPDYNPYTPEKAALGKMLYFDPRVSAGQNMNCASCHNPSFGWEAPVDRAIGSQNTPLGATPRPS